MLFKGCTKISGSLVQVKLVSLQHCGAEQAVVFMLSKVADIIFKIYVSGDNAD